MPATTRRTARGSTVVVVVVAVLAALTWYLQGGSGGGSSPDTGGGPGTVAVTDLPPEAQDTLRLIDAGGPYPYDRDGVVFENREQLLPDEPAGYYHEYTVTTPGSTDRGARRIITGGPASGSGPPSEYYWTDDHYRTFEEIER